MPVHYDHTIDLATPARDRWAEAVSQEKQLLRPALRAALKDAGAPTPPLLKLLRYAFGLLGGRYRDEIRGIASSLSLPFETVLWLQCSYELAHVGAFTGIFGCSTRLISRKGEGPLHLRTLDWALPSIRDTIRTIRFVDGTDEFFSVGPLGFVGVLTGFRPGAYSVSLNYAPPTGVRTGFGPAFLLRHALEQHRSFTAAAGTLRDTHLIVPAFFALAGASEQQALYVERTPRRVATYRPGATGKAMTNHYTTRAFGHLNRVDAAYLESSTSRMESIMAIKSRKGLLRAPLWNDDTVCAVVADPSRGRLTVTTT